MARSPSSPSSAIRSSGTRRSRSRSAVPGRIRSSAKRRTWSRRSSWSSEKLKLTLRVSPRSAGAGLGGAATEASTLTRSIPIEHPVSDHHLLDLAGAFVDFGDPCVAEVTLDVVFLGVAIATVDLERVVGHPLRHLRGEQLRL